MRFLNTDGRAPAPFYAGFPSKNTVGTTLNQPHFEFNTQN